MNFINFLADIMNKHPDPYTRCAAAFSLLCSLIGFIGGFTMVVNGLYWSFRNWKFKRMLHRNRLGLV